MDTKNGSTITRHSLFIGCLVFLALLLIALSRAEPLYSQEKIPTPTPADTCPCTLKSRGTGGWLKGIASDVHLGLQRTAISPMRGGGDTELYPPRSLCEDVHSTSPQEVWMIQPQEILLNDPHATESSVVWVESCGASEQSDATYSIQLANGDIKELTLLPSKEAERWHYYAFLDNSAVGNHTLYIATDSQVFAQKVYVRDFWEETKSPRIDLEPARSNGFGFITAPGESLQVRYSNFADFFEEATVLVGLYEVDGLLLDEWSFETVNGQYMHWITIPVYASGPYALVARVVSLGETMLMDTIGGGGTMSGFLYKSEKYAEDYYIVLQVVDDTDDFIIDEISNVTRFATTSATSSYMDAFGTYYPSNATDSDFQTSWVEGVSGPGIGQALTLKFVDPVKVNYLRLNVGYDANADLFLKNNRIRKATFVLSDGIRFQHEFADIRGLQTVSLVEQFGAPVVTSEIQVIINDIYKGTRFDDTSLSEIEVWGSMQ